MLTQRQSLTRLLGAAALTIGASISFGAVAAGGANVVAQTNSLDIPVYLQLGSLSASAAGAAIDRASGNEVASKTNALDVPFYLLPQTAMGAGAARQEVPGGYVASATNALEIPVYLRRSN
jgi:hypothetical protein